MKPSPITSEIVTEKVEGNNRKTDMPPHPEVLLNSITLITTLVLKKHLSEIKSSP
jgi:hypothetical protein